MIAAALLLVGSTMAGAGDAAVPTIDAKTRVGLWYEAFDQRKPLLIDQVVGEEWVDIPAPPGQPAGPAGLKQIYEQLTATFPDLRIEVTDMLQDGDKVVVRSRISGTHRKEFLGIPASNRRIDIQAIDIHQLQDGKIVRTWHTEDWMTGLRQLGVFPD